MIWCLMVTAKKNSSVKIILFEHYLCPFSYFPFSFAFKCVNRKKNAKSLIWIQDTHTHSTTFNQFNRKLKWQKKTITLTKYILFSCDHDQTKFWCLFLFDKQKEEKKQIDERQTKDEPSLIVSLSLRILLQ